MQVSQPHPPPLLESRRRTMALGIGATLVVIAAFVFAAVAMLAIAISFLNGIKFG